MGGSGFLGSYIVKLLEKSGEPFVQTPIRVEDRAGLIALLDEHKSKRVICIAGVAGRPNIDWCETHRPETIRANVLGAMTVVDVCHERGVHVTYFSSGSIYTYDEAHPLGSGIGFKEDEAPNFQGNFYAKMRVVLETLMKEYPNVLNLRVQYPVSGDFHERSVVSKLLKYSKIFSVPNSFTIIDDLWPLAIDLSKRGVTGTFNLVNPGVISHDEMLTLYKNIVDATATWACASPEEMKLFLASPRPNNELDASKLVSQFPPNTVPNVRDSLERLFKAYAAQKNNKA